MIKNIFGKNYSFHSSEDVRGILLESLELYSEGDKNSIDVDVFITAEPIVKRPIANNPSTHSLFLNGLKTKLGTYDVNWLKTADGRLEISLQYSKPKGIRALIRKYRHMECPTDSEVFEQVLHELVLVPSTYFFNDLMPVHASTVSVNNKTIMFAGTGGVGKSSAMLAVKDLEGAKFIADDITVVDSHGIAFGNMAWPKIYGYNCVGTNISELILKNRGLIDRIQFKFKNWLNPTMVRRKIKPNRLYPDVDSSGVKIDEMYYLFREDVDKITITDLDLKRTKAMTIAVIESEYSIFHNHLNWHEYNAIGTENNTTITMSEVKGNWSELLNVFLPSVKLKKIAVPLSISHEEYLDFIRTLLKNL